MNERLLQYIWQHQLFNKSMMKTTLGENLLIIHPGTINHNQGPDFLHATIKIENTRWVGNIELHVLSSHWNDHKHEQDSFYNNVIMHVVWQEDKSFPLRFPTFELCERVPKTLLSRYDQLAGSSAFIPCARLIGNIPRIITDKTFERCFAERLEAKSHDISNLLKEANGSWDEVAWWMLAKQFGQPVNSLPFLELARSLPWKTIVKHRYNFHQLEALLLGQAGAIRQRFSDPYIYNLQIEYRFLRKKLKLQPIHFPLRFLRMRPANFPTIRLAQLASLIGRESSVFDRIISLSDRNLAYAFFEVGTSAYWQNHYRPGDEAHFQKKSLGKSFCHQLIINLVCPLKFCRGMMHKNEKEKYDAVNLLCQLPPEDNSITRHFIKMGINPVSAADTQAMIQLKQNYCNLLSCLSCGIGHHIIKPPQDSQL